MILWWHLAGSLAVGWWVVIFLKTEWRWWLRAALAIPIGIVLTAWFSFAVSSLLRSTDAGLTITNLLLAVPLFFSVRDAWARRKNGEALLARSVAALFFFIPLLALYWLHTAYGNSLGGYSTHGYSWGDGPLHMTLASFFAEQARPLLELSILPGAKLTYPFLIDWQSGLLLKMGGGWIESIALPGALLFGAACVLSLELVRRLIGSVRTAGIHLALFMGMGSAWGLYYLVRDYVAGSPIWVTDYSNILTEQLNLANPITSHFLPQRSFLFGFALCMAVFVLLLDITKEKRWRAVLIPCVLIGLMPFAHAHSALVAMGWWVMMAVIIMLNEPKSRVWIGVGLGIMALLVIPQLWWQVAVGAAGSGKQAIGWMWNGEGSLVVYWFKQLGLVIPLILVGLILLRTKITTFAKVGLWGGLALFILGNLMLFHPSSFDNLKFMMYSFWILLIPAAYALDRLSHTKMTILVPVLVAILTVVGAHTVIRDIHPQTAYTLFSAEDILAAKDLREVLPVDARVATTERHNNVIAALTGRRVLSGYGGWLWSYGLDYVPAITAQETIMQGQDSDNALTNQYDVDFIAVGPEDRYSGLVSVDNLREKYRVIYTGHGWTVYTTGR